MEIKDPIIYGNTIYQTFKFKSVGIMICYEESTKDLKYISVVTRRSNRLGKEYKAFKEALAHYKQFDIRQALKVVDSKLLEHLIITSEEYYSFADNGFAF